MSVPHLNRALLLEEEVRTADGAGGFTQGWSSLGQLWAELRPGAGRDPAGEEGLMTLVPYRITLRAQAPGAPLRPRAGQRLREGSRIFRIAAVTERDPGGRYLLCFCREEARI